MLNSSGPVTARRDLVPAAADGLIGRAASAGQPVGICAEMVTLLRDTGQVVLALEPEALCNDLAGRLPFSLMCGTQPGWSPSAPGPCPVNLREREFIGLSGIRDLAGIPNASHPVELRGAPAVLGPGDVQRLPRRRG